MRTRIFPPLRLRGGRGSYSLEGNPSRPPLTVKGRRKRFSKGGFLLDWGGEGEVQAITERLE
jgi:hypothetical protein